MAEVAVGNQAHQREMDEMRRMFGDLLRVMQELQQREHVDACVEILEGSLEGDDYEREYHS